MNKSRTVYPIGRPASSSGFAPSAMTCMVNRAGLPQKQVAGSPGTRLTEVTGVDGVDENAGR